MLLAYKFKRVQLDHSVFVRKQKTWVTYLVVYVNEIIITGSDSDEIVDVKRYLGKVFQTKDLGHLQNILGIEVARSKQGIYISQQKYVMDLLYEASMLRCKPVDTPMDPNSSWDLMTVRYFPIQVAIGGWLVNLFI